MNINKNNYEEFFLCYADGELSAADRLAVEKFVAQNPDLEQEFSLTLASVFPAEDIHFTDTAFLLKSSAASENMQEDMLLHLDGELESEKASNIEEAITKEPLLAKEWFLLSQTKLDAEPVIFEDKVSLYRYEKVRAIPVYFWKIAAAAVMAGIFTLGGYKMLHQNPVERNSIVVNQEKQNAELPANTKILSEKKSAKTPENASVPTHNAAATLVKKQNSITNSASPLQQNKFDNIGGSSNNKNAIAQTQNKNSSVSKTAPASDKTLAKNGVTENNSLPALLELDNKISKINTSVPSKEVALVKDDLLPRKEIIDIDLSPRKPNPKVIAAAFKEEEDNSNVTRIFYFDTKDLKNTKAGAIFKKIGNVISKKNNIGKNKSLKIANLEISL